MLSASEWTDKESLEKFVRTAAEPLVVEFLPDVYMGYLLVRYLFFFSTSFFFLVQPPLRYLLCLFCLSWDIAFLFSKDVVRLGFHGFEYGNWKKTSRGSVCIVHVIVAEFRVYSEISLFFTFFTHRTTSAA